MRMIMTTVLSCLVKSFLKGRGGVMPNPDDSKSRHQDLEAFAALKRSPNNQPGILEALVELIVTVGCRLICSNSTKNCFFGRAGVC